MSRHIKIKTLDKFRDLTSDGRIVYKRFGHGFRKRYAGTIKYPSKGSTGYGQIVIDKKNFPFHRVLYELFVGPIPDGCHIDHINGNRFDNRVENLRVTTPRQNKRAHGDFSKGSSEFRGVSKSGDGKAWIARLSCPDGSRIQRRFEHEEAAVFFRDWLALECGYLNEGLNFPTNNQFQEIDG